MLLSILKTVRRRLGLALVLIGAVALPSQASAATVLFTLTGDATASFYLDQSPTPSSVNPNNFSINQVSGILQGVPDTFGVGFGTGGGFDLGANFLKLIATTTGNNDLFSGTTANPMFNLGDYALHGNIDTLGANGNPITTVGNFNLSITEVSAVPEPSTWMLMLVGFGAVGGSMRLARNRKKLDLRSA